MTCRSDGRASYIASFEKKNGDSPREEEGTAADFARPQGGGGGLCNLVEPEGPIFLEHPGREEESLDVPTCAPREEE